MDSPVNKARASSPVCIAGMHRAGTSLVARLLNLCGLYLGEAADLLPPAPDNPQGFWEHPSFLKINEQLLEQLGGSWNRPPVEWPSGWVEQPQLTSLRAEALKLLTRFDQHAPWGWKDPRTSLTLPFWLGLVPEVRVIVCLRSPLEVAQSLRKRELQSLFADDQSMVKAGYQLWQTYYQRLLSTCPPEQLLFTHYESYFCDPITELKRLVQFSQLASTENNLQRAAQTISTELYRQKSSVSALIVSDVPTDLIELYLDLCQLAGPTYQKTFSDQLWKRFAPDHQANKNIKARRLALLEARGREFEKQATALKEMKERVEQLETQLKTKNETIREQSEQIRHLSEKVTTLQNWHDIVTNRMSWRFLEQFWAFREKAVPRGKAVDRILYPLLRTALPTGPNKPQGTFKVGALFQYAGPEAEPTADLYQTWIIDNELAAADSTDVTKFSYRPLISLITPVCNPPLQALTDMIESVLAQSYPHWELCLAEANSDSPEVSRTLNKYAAQDKRIKVNYLAENSGISANSNEALSMARGEFVALLDHDDTLAPLALTEIVNLLNQDQAIDVIYSDEDRLTPSGERYAPFFKPDWSPDLLHSFMYVGHLTVYRKTLVEQLGGFRTEYDFSQDYDLLLRATEVTSAIRHIPKVLYHWRAVPESAAAGGKEFARVSNIGALEAAIKRRGYQAQVVEYPFANRVQFTTAPCPLVSIIIPTDDQDHILRQIELLLEKSSYPQFEIIVVTNSSLADTIERLHVNNQAVKTVHFDEPFNFSQKCNRGAAQAKGELLLFLNDDIAPLDSAWLEPLVEHTFRAEVGAVSPKLLYPDGTVQHAGLVTGVRRLVGTAFHQKPGNSTEYYNLIQSTRNVSALSAACLLVPKVIFNRVGGFDETNTPIANSDFDLCFKIRDEGYLLVYTPFSTLQHIGHASIAKAELKNRAKDKSDIFMLKRWAGYISYDPYFPDNMRAWLYHDSPAKYKMYGKNNPTPPRTTGAMLLVCHNLSLTGAPIILFNLANYLKKQGYFVTVMSPLAGGLAAAYQACDIPVIIDSLTHRQPQAMEHLIGQFDLVVTNTILGWPMVQAAKAAATPCIWLIHEGQYGLDIARNDPTVAKTFAMAEAVIYPSAATLNLYQEFASNGNHRFIHYGLNLPAPAKASNQPVARKKDKLYCIHIGAMEERKGQDIFLRALLQLPEELLARLEVNFLGKIQNSLFTQAVFKLAEALPNVHFVGELPHEETLAYLQQADILVCSSRDETGPIVVMEAMALGKCVITSRVGAAAEVIEPNINGLIVEVEDDYALAESLKKLVVQPQLIKELGAAARVKFDQYLTLARYGQDIMSVLKTALATEHKFSG